MGKKFEHGPIQKAWIASLRAHPERQMKSSLGRQSNDNTYYQACCLGEGGLIAGVCHWKDGVLYTKDGYTGSLDDDATDALGLRSGTGSNKKRTQALAHLNDGSFTWPEIADLLESDPENWFTHSV